MAIFFFSFVNEEINVQGILAPFLNFFFYFSFFWNPQNAADIVWRGG